MVAEGQAQSTSETLGLSSASADRFLLKSLNLEETLSSGCPFLLLYRLGETLPPPTPPSLALSESVLIEAIKLPHLIREEILIFIRPREELHFFPLLLLSSPCSPHERRGCSSVSGKLCHLLLQMHFRKPLLCLPPSAFLHPSITHCN